MFDVLWRRRRKTKDINQNSWNVLSCPASNPSHAWTYIYSSLARHLNPTSQSFSCLRTYLANSTPYKTPSVHRQIRSHFIRLEFARSSLDNYIRYACSRMRLFQIANYGLSMQSIVTVFISVRVLSDRHSNLQLATTNLM